MDSAVMKEMFESIYDTNYWGGNMSKSGRGSDPDQTEVLVSVLREFMERQNISVMVDLGCGDCTWVKEVMINPLRYYVGVDIVHSLILKNKKQYGDAYHTFLEKDVTRFVPPSTEMILCRDVMCHLLFEDALRMLAIIRKSHATWLVATTFLREGRENPTSYPVMGPMGWYPIVLTKPPFNLPEPVEILHEDSCVAGFEDKALGVWKVRDIPCPS